MSFIEDLKVHLQRFRKRAVSQPRSQPYVPEPTWVRSQVIELFERLEHQNPAPDASKLKKTFATWGDGDRALLFSRTLAATLQESFLHDASHQVLEKHVQLALARRIGLTDPVLSLPRQMELDRLAEAAWISAIHPAAKPGLEVSTYASEIRAIHTNNGKAEITPIGDVFLSLTGRDAVQWLLQVEAAQSMGPMDDWRLSKDTALYLLENPEQTRNHFEWMNSGDFPHSWSTLHRLERLGTLLIHEADEGELESIGYELLDEGKRALETLVTPNGSPFSVLAATLSQDESLAALKLEGVKTSADSSFTPSAVATAIQARLVVHEIRNALIPVQVALGSLYSSIVGGPNEATLERLRPRIDPGIDRALKFVTDLLKTSELAARVPEGFDLLRVLADAAASLATPLRIKLHVTPDLPSLSGYRERFVLAIVNLLRNAEQAGARQVLIESALEPNNRNILVTVDDDGPGVRPEDRERIFQRGVSLRPGGAGEGLALVKEVVEIELRGKIACVDKPDGGARFRMRLPVAERTPR